MKKGCSSYISDTESVRVDISLKHETSQILRSESREYLHDKRVRGEKCMKNVWYEGTYEFKYGYQTSVYFIKDETGDLLAEMG
jgi:hypothetical protein